MKKFCFLASVIIVWAGVLNITNGQVNTREEPYQSSDFKRTTQELKRNSAKIYKATKSIDRKDEELTVKLSYEKSINFANKYSDHIKTQGFVYSVLPIIDKLKKMSKTSNKQKTLKNGKIMKYESVEGTFDGEKSGGEFTLGDIMFFTELARFLLTEEAINNGYDIYDRKTIKSVENNDWMDKSIPKSIKRWKTLKYKNFGDFVRNLSD